MRWKAICDRCGFERMNTDLRKEWTGLMVCKDTCHEARHPQDYVRGKPDRQNPPWVRPEPIEMMVLDSLNFQETLNSRYLMFFLLRSF